MISAKVLSWVSYKGFLVACFVFLGGGLAPWLFSRYLYKNCRISGVFLFLFSLITYIYILLRHPAPEILTTLPKNWQDWIWLFPIIPYPIILKKYLEKVKEGHGYIVYMVLLIFIHLEVIAYL